ncbi:MAG: hypothetical protein GY854_26495 [Deltaproteobacteria bacterium]|nr:hypothetical protein [Deltaproteobacteria bacterium]
MLFHKWLAGAVLGGLTCICLSASAQKGDVVDDISEYNVAEDYYDGYLNYIDRFYDVFDDSEDIEWQLTKCPSLKLLKLTVILTANDDGTQSMGEIVNGKTIPASPYWRDPTVHSEDESYILEQIKIANHHLLASGACFILDTRSVIYKLETNTALNRRECRYETDEDIAEWERTAQFIRDKQNLVQPWWMKWLQPNPYSNRIFVIYRWGKGEEPTGQGCSGYDMPYILMPGRYTNSRYIDGEVHFGNDHLAHELGHYLSLIHPFPGVANSLTEVVGPWDEDKLLNPMMVPLSFFNMSWFDPSVDMAMINEWKDQAIDLTKRWVYSFDQDGWEDTDNDLPGVYDTPIDLGLGFPLSRGHLACTGEPTFTVIHYDNMTDTDEDGFGDPTPPVTTTDLTIQVTEKARDNVMSYWGCDPLGQTFTPDQVVRMTKALTLERANVVGRTVSRWWYWATIYPFLDEYIPEWQPPEFNSDPWEAIEEIQVKMEEGLIEIPVSGAVEWLDRIDAENDPPQIPIAK